MLDDLTGCRHHRPNRVVVLWVRRSGRWLSNPQVPLGSVLPHQTLADITGEYFLPDLRGEGVLVVLFAANHCPYVRHIEAAFDAVASEYSTRGALFAAICSNDVQAYPDDDIPGLTAQVERAGWNFPDPVHDEFVAKAFGAVRTPDLFVYDINGRLGYRGAFDCPPRPTASRHRRPAGERPRPVAGHTAGAGAAAALDGLQHQVEALRPGRLPPPHGAPCATATGGGRR